MRRRSSRDEAERLTMPHGGDGMIGGTPDEITVDRRGDGRVNVDSYFRAERLEHRLVLTDRQCEELVAKLRALQ